MLHIPEVDWTRRTCSLANPDLNPLDFLFGGYLKSIVYETPIATEENITAQIAVSSADITSTPDLIEHVTQSFARRCLCTDLRGRKFEQFP
ncbi:hypothetical protein TNCV_40451 [Trichonephila clavipes]|nr:hypothetical protein TNCV_40451 [Trichonephila clavipes]